MVVIYTGKSHYILFIFCTLHTKNKFACGTVPIIAPAPKAYATFLRFIDFPNYMIAIIQASKFKFILVINYLSL